MIQTSHWYEATDKVINLNHQLLHLIELMQSRNIPLDVVFSGTQVFAGDLLKQNKLVSPAQTLKLIENCISSYHSNDLSFRWGQMLWPGHYGPFSQLLSGARSVKELVQNLIRFRQQLCPLLVPVAHIRDQYCFIEWRDAVGLGELKHFMVEAYMFGLVSACEWLAGETFSWRFGFDTQKPSYDEQYHTHFGEHLAFNVGLDVMVLSEKDWEAKWAANTSSPRSDAALHFTQRLCEETAPAQVLGFVELLQAELNQALPQALSMEALAFKLNMSASTFKRKLAAHQSHFQALQDQARKRACFYKLHLEQQNNEQLSQYLNFNNVANFRRAFKRWFGTTPSLSKHDSMVLQPKESS